MLSSAGSARSHHVHSAGPFRNSYRVEKLEGRRGGRRLCGGRGGRAREGAGGWVGRARGGRDVSAASAAMESVSAVSAVSAVWSAAGQRAHSSEWTEAAPMLVGRRCSSRRRRSHGCKTSSIVRRAT